MSKHTAVLRVCASCEWVFRKAVCTDCPKCGFASYGARFVYGDKAYSYERTQRPWKDKKLCNFEMALDKEIRASPTKKKIIRLKLKLTFV